MQKNKLKVGDVLYNIYVAHWGAKPETISGKIIKLGRGYAYTDNPKMDKVLLSSIYDGTIKYPRAYRSIDDIEECASQRALTEMLTSTFRSFGDNTLPYTLSQLQRIHEIINEKNG